MPSRLNRACPNSLELLMNRIARSRPGASSRIAVSLLAGALAACGGGSGSGGSIDSASGSAEVILEAGQTRQVAGTISTSRFLLKSASWRVSAQSMGAPALTLSNENCASVTPSDIPITLAVGTTPEGSGRSEWACDLGVTAPASVTSDVTYTLTLTGTDASGATHNVTKTLRLKAGASTGASTVSAGQDFSVTSGKTAPLACTGPANSRYQWVVKENAGLPISLSTTTAEQSSFIAPTVTRQTRLIFECRATDSADKVSSSTVNVTVLPTSSTANVAGQDFTVLSGRIAPLSCAGPAGSQYQWVITQNSGLPIALSTNNGAQATFTAPVVSATTLLAFECRITEASGNTSTGSVNVIVQPSPTGPISAGQAFSVFPGRTAPLSCSGPADGLYQWAVTNNSGLPISLANPNSAQASFIAPSVISATTIALECRHTSILGVAQSSAVNVTIQPQSSVSNPAGLDFSVVSGAAAPLACTGPADGRYQWVVKQNQGLPISLSSYTSATSGFTAPVVAANTPLEMECRITDSAGATSTSSVVVTVLPSPANTSTLVARAEVTGTVSPGNTITLNGSAAWFDSRGVATGGPVIDYTWAVDSAFQNSGIVILSSKEPSTRISVPSTIAAPATIPFTLTVTADGSQPKTATVNVVVDPFGPLFPVITPAIASIPADPTVPANRTVTLTVDAGALQTGSTRAYFQWRQVSGPTLELSATNTATLGVNSPAGQSGTAVIEVTVSNYPISGSNPSVYTAEVLIVISP